MFRKITIGKISSIIDDLRYYIYQIKILIDT